jgi:cytochrome b pre-mRNA-processing protein 3
MLQAIKAFFITNNNIEKIYWDIIQIARDERLYTDYGIDDTVDGRFDSIMLHLCTYIFKLNQQNPNNKQIAENLVNIMVSDMDRSLREMGVGDMGISRKMRRIGQAYMGRYVAYEKGFNALPNVEELETAIFKNVFRMNEDKNKYCKNLVLYILDYFEGIIL